MQPKAQKIYWIQHIEPVELLVYLKIASSPFLLEIGSSLIPLEFMYVFKILMPPVVLAMAQCYNCSKHILHCCTVQPQKGKSIYEDYLNFYSLKLFEYIKCWPSMSWSHSRYPSCDYSQKVIWATTFLADNPGWRTTWDWENIFDC